MLPGFWFAGFVQTDQFAVAGGDRSNSIAPNVEICLHFALLGVDGGDRAYVNDRHSEDFDRI
ncbi:MAG: hypothetical protein JGK38_11955 [Microcoleus sp. PH2017_15_JOR_U_A]|uniref:hypothetical protein n=1 Tax=unclassified Microcoleus TaxID=2642155 RepID=UPI001E02A577|nr:MULTISPECIES: hypothetical protein [unclassified Microcoleus]MCC3485097.1 hypothetical protein [Microcoleus sp. PH2017_14_LAR_D_A]MCC3497335.1 hypothetical protein [Microcoleus sp. PH2017_15_JOR_U_A]MCC3554101.1 hypothetical protein [Microcoleus sp. PH2017_35_SFW_U_B]MCC3472645.1 hypothetical protein [Microcoleus sp. PH2017_13_LAR_U_A]MCC3597822.1 hypothetical protein [Microcoleus sp. PH2017_26_ELK_O_A]